ncbi:amidohydrolase family protein [Corallococcus sp. M34]|uniref:amidohydrolase family protein n=1 Tax=Citreicoccus inhibens TaxID=2849499 RepID=UPI001C21A4FD|nr:amidohydrolase family protein [Citreicoccus inhibens]MBU8899724.1 amidohydrolase family protein [Citreicoccus inhibens]
MKTYTVQDGDTPHGLASLFGFKDWKSIYEHKSNEALRGKRGPNEIQPGDSVTIPDAFIELPSGSSATLMASEKLPLAPVIIDAHMHIMSGNCTPFPVAYYTQIEPRVSGLLSPASSRKTLNGVGKVFSFVMPFLGWSPRVTLKIGEDTVDQNDSVPAVFRKMDAVKELRDCRPSFLGISIVLTMDMDLCQLDGYKGYPVYREAPANDSRTSTGSPVATPEGLPPPTNGLGKTSCDANTPTARKEKKRYLFNTRLTGAVDERPDTGVAHPGEWGLFEQWSAQLLATKVACAEHPLRLIPMYHYEPRRYSKWTGQEKSFKEASLAPNWDRPFSQLATESQAGMFAGFKMYTSQAYQPIDPHVPSLAKFFARCAQEGVPIMTHCTPSGHFTHDRRLYIDLDPAAADTLSQTDKDAYQDGRKKRDAYLDAKEVHTQKEKTFKDYCAEKGLALNPYLYQQHGMLAADMGVMLPAEYWQYYGEYEDARTAMNDAGEDYERIARSLRNHEEISARYKRANKDLAKMDQDPPLRLKYFKEKHLHPEAWRPLLEKHPKLKLCLAHFASDTCLWSHYLKDENAKCRDLDDVEYEKNWVTSIVDLCDKFENFYTDLSYLPLLEPLVPYPARSKQEEKALSKMVKDKKLPLMWQGLAKACKANKKMLTKIMFGSDWYMILASKKSYSKWYQETIEGLSYVEKELNLPRKVNLFYQFAVVNPMRFYRLPLIADNLKAGIEAFVNDAPLTEEEKEERFSQTSERMTRNYPILKNLAAVLEKVESASGDDKGRLYLDQVRFVNVVPTS